MVRAWVGLCVLGLSMSAAAEEPPAEAEVTPIVELKYKLRFDMDGMGDQLCASTGFCDCTAEFKGAGQLVESEGVRRTFEGSWTLESNDCNPNLTPWVPSDGKAFHTVRMSADGASVDEWLVHADRTKPDRLTSGMKEGKQYWIAEMGAPLNPETGVMVHAETESQRVQIMSLTTVHNLQMTMSPPSTK